MGQPRKHTDPRLCRKQARQTADCRRNQGNRGVVVRRLGHAFPKKVPTKLVQLGAVQLHSLQQKAYPSAVEQGRLNEVEAIPNFLQTKNV
jgi:hypothetical protein